MPPRPTTAATSTVAATIAARKKPSSSSIFSLKFGCKDAKSVSISHSRPDSYHKAADPATTSLSGRHHPPPTLSSRHGSSSADGDRPGSSSADTITITTATTSTSHDEKEEVDSPSFSGLLRQLSELERNVAAWDRRRRIRSGCVSAGEAVETEEAEEKACRPADVAGFGSNITHLPRQAHHGQGRHRRSQSEGGGADRRRVVGKVGECVAVVKQTEDPLGDFRRSMLQMIVEKEILSGKELRELLCRFLALNSPSHHAVIIRAFADIWHDVFSGYDNGTADVLPRHRLSQHGRDRRYY